MTAKNDVTGDLIKSKHGNKEAFDQNYDAIFRKTPEAEPVQSTGSDNDAGADSQRGTPLVGGMGFRRVDREN